MNDIALKGMRKLLRRLVQRLANVSGLIVDNNSNYQQQQKVIVNQWKTWREQGSSPYKSIQEAGFRCYSQFEEDGIILYMLTMIGISNGTVLELCCGDGIECMSTNLTLNHGFKAYMFDGDKDNIEKAKYFYSKQKDCLLEAPTLMNSWITKENVNKLVKESGCPYEVDLLSLDLDGNDYWIWETLDAVNPKICCFETHNIIPSNLSVSIPYNPNFECWSQTNPDFRTASLLAMVRLSERKGYTLVGTHRHGFNAFFVRNDLLNSFLTEHSVSESHNNRFTKISQQQRWPHVSHMPWCEVP